jgi:hypothetical protein
VEVKWYSGYKGHERPETIIVNGEEQLVKRVISEELVEDEVTGSRKRVFVVETAKGTYRIVSKEPNKLNDQNQPNAVVLRAMRSYERSDPPSAAILLLNLHELLDCNRFTCFKLAEVNTFRN